MASMVELSDDLRKRLQRCEAGGGKELDLRDLHLRKLPHDVFRFAATLEFLNLGGNSLSSLPEDFHLLKQLKILFFAGNDFEVFPEVLGKLERLYMVSFKANKLRSISETSLSPSIGWLILTDNQLQALPDSIGSLTNLRKCMLASNQLRTLPPSMVNCKKLELLRISMNHLEAFPAFLEELPMISWLSYAGNPFCAKPDEPRLPLVSLDSLELREKLGEGASGEVYRAVYKDGSDKDPVAVKLFKGQATSDGSPLDEMKIVMLIGSFGHTIKPLGKIVNSKDPGLVLELIPKSYELLGGPPSFESVTRDTFAPEKRFSMSFVVNVLLSMAGICIDLHRRGISHGDLYAHNIVADSKGNAILCDYGAATYYTKKRQNAVHFLEQVELGAFGCLIEDLLSLTDVSTAKKEKGSPYTVLSSLRAACLRPANMRPAFRSLAVHISRVQRSIEQGHEDVDKI